MLCACSACVPAENDATLIGFAVGIALSSFMSKVRECEGRDKRQRLTGPRKTSHNPISSLNESQQRRKA